MTPGWSLGMILGLSFKQTTPFHITFYFAICLQRVFKISMMLL
jgi:hypothetical protein